MEEVAMRVVDSLPLRLVSSTMELKCSWTEAMKRREKRDLLTLQRADVCQMSPDALLAGYVTPKIRTENECVCSDSMLAIVAYFQALMRRVGLNECKARDCWTAEGEGPCDWDIALDKE